MTSAAHITAIMQVEANPTAPTGIAVDTPAQRAAPAVAAAPRPPPNAVAAPSIGVANAMGVHVEGSTETRRVRPRRHLLRQELPRRHLQSQLPKRKTPLRPMMPSSAAAAPPKTGNEGGSGVAGVTADMARVRSLTYMMA